MDNFELILKELLSNDFEKNALKEIRQMLYDETAKPASERDYDKIEELTNAYSELSGMENFVQEAAERGIQELTEQTRKPRIRMTKRIRIMITVAFAALVLLAANAITVAAWDMDVFTAIIHFTKDGFSVDFPEHETIVLPTSEDDPYGIKGECAKYGLEVEAPTYLPEGFVLKHVENESMVNYQTYVNLYFYRNGREAILFSYALLDSEFANSSIPSDEFNLSEVYVNGKHAIVSKEDEQYNIIWIDSELETAILLKMLIMMSANRLSHL